MNFDPRQMAMQLMQNNQKLANNPMAQEGFNILMSGDAAKGEEFAMNLCKTYGITKEQAIEMARQRFGGMFGKGPF